MKSCEPKNIFLTAEKITSAVLFIGRVTASGTVSDKKSEHIPLYLQKDLYMPLSVMISPDIFIPLSFIKNTIYAAANIMKIKAKKNDRKLFKDVIYIVLPFLKVFGYCF